MTTFLHTADWQLGKPYARIEDDEKRALAKQKRIETIDRLAELSAREGAAFVLVAGDLFDSASVSQSTVSAACAAIGRIPVPVLVIPGNHDHAGAGSIWEQGFFKREAAHLAPNLVVLDKAEPFEMGDAVIFPCPLVRRRFVEDPTGWLRSGEAFETAGGKCRIVLAHGSVQDFGSQSDEEDGGHEVHIGLDRLPLHEVDYVALGDWHGTVQINNKAWYSGTHEPDRHSRGAAYAPGNVLLVEAGRTALPRVSPFKVGACEWHELSFRIGMEGDLERLQADLDALAGESRRQYFLKLHLSGIIGIKEREQLEGVLEAWRARTLRLQVRDELVLSPTTEELHALLSRVEDPNITQVATRLNSLLQDPEQAEVARIALVELHTALRNSSITS